MIFGSRLADAVTRMEITDAVFARNLRNYARQCIFHALLLGHISADDLRETTDLWALVTAGGSPSAGASPARLVEFATRQAAGATGATPVESELVTCAEAAARLDALWAGEIGRAAGIFGIRLFPDADTEALARAELLAALPAAHDFLIGASRTAADIIQQQMLLNAIHDAGEQWSTETGNAAALRAYTEARTEAQTVAAYRAIGRQAETWVPLLRIVFECLYVGAFPMAVLLMLTPAGGSFFRAYLGGFVWLQSWGPLYAIDRDANTVNLRRKDGEMVGWTPHKLAARTGGAEVYRCESFELRVGDRIRWTKNDNRLGLINSQTADVTGVKKGTVTFALEDGRTLDLKQGDAQLRHIDRAWASTVHAFQGRTVDTVIAAMEAGHPHLTTQKTLYVEISRARDRAELVTDDAGKLRERLEQASGERVSALEGIGEAAPDSRKEVGGALDTVTGAAPEPVPDAALGTEKSMNAGLSERERRVDLDIEL